MNDRDIDAEFDAIVARWDDGSQEPSPSDDGASRSPRPDGADENKSAAPELRPGEDSSGVDDAPTTPTRTGPPERPLTVHDITAAYAALSRREDQRPPARDESDELDHDGRREAEDAPDARLDKPAPEVWRAPTTSEPDPDADGFDDDEDDHYDPPAVQLPPTEDIGYWGALLGLVGGPLVLLWVLLTHPFNRGWWIFGAILLFIGGFALLVMRQPAHRDPFDGDDGARV